MKLADAIDRAGFGFFHFKACLLGGGMFLADGAELLLISTVTDVLAKEWDLSPTTKGLGVSITFFGMLVGCLISGPIGDILGRKQVIVGGYTGVFVFSLISSFAPGIVFLIVIRFLVGLSCGIGLPCWNSLGAELTPSLYRMVMQCAGQTLFAVGEMYTALLVYAQDPELEDLNWRLLLQLGAIPAGIYMVLAPLFLAQSPSFLCITGKSKEAKEVVQQIYIDNGTPDADVDFEPPEVIEQGPLGEHLMRQFSIVFGKERRYTTYTLMYQCIVLNFSYYGVLYVMPQVLPDINLPGSPALELFLGALLEIPGYIIGWLLSVWLRRIPLMTILVTTIFTFVLVFAVLLQCTTFEDSASVFLATVCYYGIKIFPQSLFVVTYQYLAEYYPTEVRATGTSVCMSCGRIGAVASPVIIEWLADTFGGHSAYFFLLSGLCVFDIPAVLKLPLETKGRKLVDRALDEEEVEKSLKS